MRLLATLTIIFLIFALSGFGQDKTFTFKGKVHTSGETLKGASIDIYDSGDLVFETTSKGGGKFDFELKSERQYMVEIYMENLRTKTIWINTKRTEKLKIKIPTFGFDVYLKVEEITPYDELSEIPVTLIKYKPKKKAFYMDKGYENAVKNKKKRIKENILIIR